MHHLIILISLFAIQFSLLSATPIRSMDEQTSKLAEQIQSPKTLLLTVHSESDLPDAQRLLTLAASQDIPAIVLISLPDNAIESIAIRRSASRFFRSDFSRPLTYFIEAADHPYPEFKTLLLSPIEPAPLFASETYPQALPLL
ncbi:hypothetical protein [Pelagicoccus sp. SDUM812002]|uniref:hypothetical protein n=1 Tax=Pelagicoccus sp. SDUM812002 TaxID=3041266 RepID=UPI00280CCDFE|nr:hypothetical protein [Pelagicoccus sp. SDUM812002]MDQ8185860.1 hypothetical protein [Pelagicoccus sp. SDUM812002]